MQNFDYQTPTRLIFGKGVIEKLPGVMAQFGKNILLTYGGGSIKKIGLYQKVHELLKGFEIVELPGIQPNPKYNPSGLDEMAHHIAVNEGLENAYVPLAEKDIREILIASL